MLTRALSQGSFFMQKMLIICAVNVKIFKLERDERFEQKKVADNAD